MRSARGQPWAAAVDVVLTFAASDVSRAAGMALLSTPLLRFDADPQADVDGATRRVTPDAVAAADCELADAMFVGGRERLGIWRRGGGRRSG